MGRWDGNPSRLQIVAAGTSQSDQLYSMMVFPYYSIYLGLVNTYDNSMAKGSWEDRVRCELAWSPDSVTWHRLKDESRKGKGHETDLIPLGIAGDVFDAFDCFYANPVVVDGEVRLYYMGGDGPHF